MGRRYDSGVVHGVPLQTPDIHRTFHHIPAAPGLTGMLTYQTADPGEGIVLPDEPHSVGIPAGAHQGDVTGDIHPRRTLGDTGHRLVQIAQAAAGFHMGNIVVPEAFDALEHHVGSLVTDGTVGAVADNLGGALNHGQRIHGGPAFQYILNEKLQLPQANPAGHALAAGLGMAHFQKRRRQIHGAKTGRAGNNPMFQIPVQRFHHGLRTAGGIKFQSTHTFPPVIFFRPPRRDSPICILL